MTIETNDVVAPVDGSTVGEHLDVSRRHALRNTVAAVGLAATLGRVGSGAVTGTRGAASAPQPGLHRLTLHTNDLVAPSFMPLRAGQSTTTAATLSGEAEGHLVSTITALTDASGQHRFMGEQQTIVLADATIVGSGVRVVGSDTATFAIIGGTGRYLGARGEYTVVGMHAAQGGTGTAEYRFTIIVDGPIGAATSPTAKEH
jgi:hypothetical protein